MSDHREITRHLIKWTAEHELGRIWKVQEAALKKEPEAIAELVRLAIDPTTLLEVRHESKHRYKWCVCTRG